MSQFVNVSKKCAVCGKEYSFTEILSTNSFGYCDLDTRPPGMERSCLRAMIHRCPNCQYANYDIEELIPESTREALNCVYYQEIVNDGAIEDAAKSFLLAGFLYSRAKLYAEAGLCFLRAAWVFDDALQNQFAIRARQNAVECLIRHDNSDENMNINMAIVDIYRRIRNFEAAKNYATQLLERGVDEEISQVLRYELILIKSKNTACHSIGEMRGFFF